MSSYLGTTVVLGHAGTPVKRDKKHSLNSWGFDQLSWQDFDNVASIGAGVATSTIQTRVVLPHACKIPKVGFSCSAIDNIQGNDTFNLVLGTAATYTGVPPNDNQEVLGYPSAFGTYGQALFATDVPISATTFPALPGGIAALTVANGGSGIVVPTNWDAIILGGTILTLRVKTVGSTGSLSNVKVSLLVAIVDTFPVGPTDGTQGIPGQGF